MTCGQPVALAAVMAVGSSCQGAPFDTVSWVLQQHSTGGAAPMVLQVRTPISVQGDHTP